MIHVPALRELLEQERRRAQEAAQACDKLKATN